MSCYDSFYFALISFDFSEMCSYRSNDFCITAFNMLESTVVMFVRLRLSENNVVKAICSPVEKSFINFEYTAWFITFIFFLCTEVSIYGSLVCYFSLSASQRQWESSFSCILDYTSSNMIIIPMYICFFFVYASYFQCLRSPGIYCCVMYAFGCTVKHSEYFQCYWKCTKISADLIKSVSVQKPISKLCLLKAP